MSNMAFDLLTIGRVSLDLFAQNIGVPFTEVRGFDTSVGGSPVNIAIGSSRLGLKTATLTAVGEDLVGDFVLGYLARAGVATDYIPRKANARTGLALVAVQPPNRFPLVFYRDHPADIDLTIDDVANAPLAQCRVVQLSGTAFGRGSCREAMLFAVEQCRNAAVTTVIDLDLRPDQWSDPRAFGVILRAMLPQIQIVIGTEEEFFALLAADPTPALQGGPLLPAQLAALEEALQGVLAAVQSPKILVVKRGARGVSLYPRGGPSCHVPGFSVEVVNTVGAGDAFASGLIYGYLQGWAWQQCARFGNACGALTVTRHGCAAALPYLAEVQEFLKLHGG